MNYTKGEWQIGRYGNNRFEILADKRVAIVDTWDNANLIAAAPDMYEALKGLVDDWVITNGERVSESTMRIIYNSLAKAEGKC